MIENLRKYTGLIIVLVVLVLVGFLFMDTSTMRAAGSGAPYLKIAGRQYSDKEFNHLGNSSYQLVQTLMQSGNYDLYSFLLPMVGKAQSESQMVENFFTNRILLREAKEDFGIFPGHDEVDSFIRQLRVFSGPDGAFSQEKYRQFIERGIGRLGLTENDVLELASDILAQRKLADILGAGLTGNRAVVGKTLAMNAQSVRTNVARIDIDAIEASISPTEEEIKTYWETIRDAFMTKERRKFTYLIATPSEIPEPEPLASLPGDADDAAKAAFEKTRAEREAALAEARRGARLAIDEKVDNFLYQLEERKGADFEELAEKDGWKLKTTELVAQDEAPADLQAPLRSSSARGTAATELFLMQPTADPSSKISPAFAIGEDQWLIARLDEVEKSRVQTFEEARDEARARLIAEKSSAALKETAEAAVSKIKDSLAAGRTFAEAAKEAGITNETLNLTEITSTYQPDTTKLPANLFDASRYTDPGGIAEPVIEADRAFLIHVEAREVEKKDFDGTIVEREIERTAETNKFSAFASWLDNRSEAADIQQLYRQ